jgi:hypothetical protein
MPAFSRDGKIIMPGNRADRKRRLRPKQRQLAEAERAEPFRARGPVPIQGMPWERRQLQNPVEARFYVSK